ncbi:MAG: hypothetical protein ACUVSB_03570, partial [Anaerolineae bacterium]
GPMDSDVAGDTTLPIDAGVNRGTPPAANHAASRMHPSHPAVLAVPDALCIPNGCHRGDYELEHRT